MSRYDNTKRNQYNSTPRKVFDAYIDKMAIRRKRDMEDHRADMKALIHRLNNMELAYQELAEQYDDLQHDLAIMENQFTPKDRKRSNEELG